MSDPNTTLAQFAYAFALAGSVGQAIGFTITAVNRKAPSWSDRALFYVVAGALTINGFGAAFAHEYGRAALCALAMALAGAAYGAANARAARAASPGAEAPSAPGPRAESASPYGRRWRRTRRPRPYH